MVAYYILKGKTPVQCHDFPLWAKWHATADRVVGTDYCGNLCVSTVFIGIDERGDGTEDLPRLFETMMFDLARDCGVWLCRCATWEDAERQHARAVNAAMRWMPKNS